ncbi:MAG: response regulator [Ferruginibacter sp.]|nr:response regulator [Ferruginibacter sp.]
MPAICFVLLVRCLFSFAQPAPYQFNRIDISKGLSNNQVNSIFKDAKGFMWFGTMAGLNRYDGNKFKVFKHDARDSTSLNDDFITRIMEGPGGKLWVDTRRGFTIFDITRESFDSNISAALSKMSIPASTITSIVKDSTGDFWFLMNQRSLYKYHSANQQTSLVYSTRLSTALLTSFALDKLGNKWLIKENGGIEKLDSKTNKALGTITAVSSIFKNETYNYNLFADAQNELWIFAAGDPKGLLNYNPVTGKLRIITKDQGTCRLNNNNVINLLQDNKGKIWINTDHGGINVLDKTNYTMHYILNNVDDNKSISQNSISAAYKDNGGIIWIGTYKKGISYYLENSIKFPLYKHQPSNKNSLPYDDVNRFAEDAKGNLWIGTNGGGLIYYDRLKSTYIQYTHNPADASSLSNDVIVSLYLDHQQRLWIGTYFGGMDRLDGNRFIHYRHDPANPHSLSDDRVYEIYEDSKKNLWIGTLNGGLDRLDREKNIFYHHKAGDPNSIQANYISSIIEDKAGDLWIGTSYGIAVYHYQTGTFTYYIHSQNDSTTISQNNIICIMEDSRGLVWVGTRDGLNVFNKKNKNFQYFRREDGLPSNAILNVLEDDKHHLWISTPEGLATIEVQMGTAGLVTITPKKYEESDGMQGKDFNENAAFKTSKGELIFGGSNGFNMFHPNNFVSSKNVPNLTITDFQIFNKSMAVGESINKRVLLTKAINQTEKITLNYNENVFSIEFADLNFYNTGKNSYACKLEGFSKAWLTMDNNIRKATFTNLDPGNYSFMVRSTNEQGGWNKEIKLLTINVLPPFWRTPLAFIIYLLVIAGILLFARYILLQKARLKYEVKHERQEAKRMHELDMMKIKFFTNVSHEFRTPLSLIITPLDKIISQSAEPDQKKHFQLIQRNAKRLLNMVNQLLDFRKLEVQEIKLNLSKGDIVQFTRDAVTCFTDIAEKKQVSLSFQSSLNELEAVFDKDKLERILFNLLSNAFKFTLEKGKVTVTVNELVAISLSGMETMQVQIQVADTGIGIQQGKKDKIFENFFQLDMPGTIVNQGSGIGLSITKEFVRLHGGTISVESVPEEGSCFTILLPVVQQLQQKATGEIFRSSLDHTDLLELTGENASASDMEMELSKLSGRRNGKKSTVLLVEDNEDFRFYLKDNLREFYNIIEAFNGREGWDKAKQFLPDLIVTDVNMPEMNGIELCKKIKTERLTSHIPVIILTARSAEEHQLEGYETGANDYMGKPFNFEILQSRIRNLLAQQESLRKLFQKQIDVNPSEITITSVDEKFMQQALEVVEKNLGEPDFSVEDLSRELFMSRVSLYKKIHILTGKAPLEFIRSIRLKRAARLLEKSQLSISEIAYQVGFNNPKYFARYFKAEFKVNPSVYQNEKKQGIDNPTIPG